MKTNTKPTTTGFLQTVALAMSELKQKLQRDYELAYPELAEIVHLILDEEESRAWNMTLFPHLVLPDLVEAHVAQLSLRPADTKHDDLFAPHHFDNHSVYGPAMAFCG